MEMITALELVLRRRPSGETCTIGELYANGNFACYILEDVVREVKIPGKSAIFQGRYQITITLSKRFGRMLPLLHEVQEFEGVRIHPGNTHLDTEGCLLPGMSVTPDGNSVLESRYAFNKLYKRIEEALKVGEVWIDIRNAPLPA